MDEFEIDVNELLGDVRSFEECVRRLKKVKDDTYDRLTVEQKKTIDTTMTNLEAFSNSLKLSAETYLKAEQSVRELIDGIRVGED